jgi:hypothetical protein
MFWRERLYSLQEGIWTAVVTERIELMERTLSPRKYVQEANGLIPRKILLKFIFSKVQVGYIGELIPLKK